MENDYSDLLREYPEIISADQLYRICKISKRKAKWLLDNGIIPCHDTGKVTHRYRIRIEDVIAYLQIRELNPQAVAPPVGLLNAEKGERTSAIEIDRDELEQFLHMVWKNDPDALTAEDIQALTGYSLTTIKRWICHKKLRSVSTPNETIVAKQWLVEFMSRYMIAHANQLSKKSSQLLKKHIKNRQNSADLLVVTDQQIGAVFI